MLTFDRRGTGIPVVFVHAFPLSHTMWEPQAARLSRNFQVISPDLPGFGHSSLNGSTTSMEEMARAVLDLLDHLKVTEKCVFAGLSMGGYVLFQILKLAPERVRALALVSTRAAADSDEGRAKRYKTIEVLEKQGLDPLAGIMMPFLLGKTALQTQPALVKEIETLIKKENVAGVTAALRGMAERPDSTSLLATISVPTLVVSGTEDLVIPTAEMEKMAAAIPQADFRRIEGAGHLLNMEKPDVFNEQFLNFLKRRVL